MSYYGFHLRVKWNQIILLFLCERDGLFTVTFLFLLFATNFFKYLLFVFFSPRIAIAEMSNLCRLFPFHLSYTIINYTYKWNVYVFLCFLWVPLLSAMLLAVALLPISHVSLSRYEESSHLFCIIVLLCDDGQNFVFLENIKAAPPNSDVAAFFFFTVFRRRLSVWLDCVD